jgi:hypothetical protein
LETPTAPKDALQRELAEELPEVAAEQLAVMEDKLSVTEETPGTVAPDVEGEELAQKERKRSEADIGKKGLATTTTVGRSSDEQPARGALVDAPEKPPAEKKTDELASKSKGEFAAGEGAPETGPPVESLVDADVDFVAANKAAPKPSVVTTFDSFDDTVAVAAAEEQLVIAAVDSAGGEILQSIYDDEKRLTALVVELPRDQYETFLQRLGTGRDDSPIRLLSAVKESESASRRQDASDARTIILKIRLR